MPNSEKMSDRDVAAVIDAGTEVWNTVLDLMSRRGISHDLASSVLAVAVGGAMTAESITGQQFLTIIQQTLLFWRVEQGSDGPTLLFSNPLCLCLGVGAEHAELN